MKKLIKFLKEFFSLKNYKGQYSNFILIAAIILLSSFSLIRGELRQDKEKTKQCIGLTKKGERCKRKIVINAKSTYCYQHSVDTDKKNKK